jgi:pimeloyl-ACP methyl ester carboxylesterase
MATVRTFDFEGNTVKYLTAGEGDNYAVILQGWATKSELYSSVIDTLSEKYTVIFPLFSGFGESAEPKNSFCVDDYARLTNTLLYSLGIKEAVFFCHSYGGRVFYKLNARDDRATRPTSVILSDTAGIVPKKSLYKRLRIKIYKLGRRILSTKVMRFFFPDALEELRRKNGSADYNSATPVMRETLVRSVNEDLSDLIPLVNCPALVMWGVNDDAVPLSDAYKIRDAIKDAAVIEFSSSGHFPFITERARFLAVMRSFFSI